MVVKTKKINAENLKHGQFFRRGRKKAVWQRDDGDFQISGQQITGRGVGKFEKLAKFEQVIPVKVKITVTS